MRRTVIVAAIVAVGNCPGLAEAARCTQAAYTVEGHCVDHLSPRERGQTLDIDT
jgi:hypothetical protein